jgi:hypothetical protein
MAYLFEQVLLTDMSYIPFDAMPERAKLWIFAADRQLSAAESDALVREMQSFVHTWLAHGHPVTGSSELKYGQFLFIAADEASLPSGCATDEMMRRVRMLGESFGVEFLGMPRVHYRLGEAIATTSRQDFADLAKTGTVESSTVVFDNTVPTIADLRAGKWELPAKASWHAKAFEFVR